MSDFASQIGEVERRITENCSAYFPYLSGGDIRVECRPFTQRSTYPLLQCRIFSGDRKTEHPSLIVKFTPVYPDNNEGETEYRHLILMEKHLAGVDHLRVPRAVDYYPDLCAVVTEEAPGERFNGVLLRGTSTFAPRARVGQLARYMGLCGEWLARFHDATRREARPAFADEFREAVGERLAQLKAGGFSSSTEEMVGETLRALQVYGERHTIPMAGFHGDFGPQNIHVGKDWVCVFDLSYAKEAAIYDDLTYFLVTLETMNPFPRHPFFSRRRAMGLGADLVRGYFGSGGPTAIDEIMLAGYYLKALVFRAAKQRRNVSAKPGVVRLWFDRARIAGYYSGRIRRQCETIHRHLKH